MVLHFCQEPLDHFGGGGLQTGLCSENTCQAGCWQLTPWDWIWVGMSDCRTNIATQDHHSHPRGAYRCFCLVDLSWATIQKSAFDVQNNGMGMIIGHPVAIMGSRNAECCKILIPLDLGAAIESLGQPYQSCVATRSIFWDLGLPWKLLKQEGTGDLSDCFYRWRAQWMRSSPCHSSLVHGQLGALPTGYKIQYSVCHCRGGQRALRRLHPCAQKARKLGRAGQDGWVGLLASPHPTGDPVCLRSHK